MLSHCLKLPWFLMRNQLFLLSTPCTWGVASLLLLSRFFVSIVQQFDYTPLTVDPFVFYPAWNLFFCVWVNSYLSDTGELHHCLFKYWFCSFLSLVSFWNPTVHTLVSLMACYKFLRLCSLFFIFLSAPQTELFQLFYLRV